MKEIIQNKSRNVINRKQRYSTEDCQNQNLVVSKNKIFGNLVKKKATIKIQ